MTWLKTTMRENSISRKEAKWRIKRVDHLRRLSKKKRWTLYVKILNKWRGV